MLTRSSLKLARSRVHSTISRTFSRSGELDFGTYGVILPPEPFVYGVSHIPIRSVPITVPRPPYVGNKEYKEDTRRTQIQLGSEEEIRLRNAAQLAKRVREHVSGLVKAGVTTDEIDAKVHDFILSKGAYPSPLLYQGFPKSCCTSVNNILVHGIPDNRRLEDGDIVNVDITIFLNGFHGDTSDTWLVGSVDLPGRTLVEATSAALDAGIDACGPGRPFKEIGKAIHNLLKRPFKGHDFSTSTAFNGHGIGTVFHREPWIIHNLNDEPGIMQPGDCFTIEPIIIEGNEATEWIFPDGWTASTENCARAAQKEHMVLITECGAEVLTR